MSRILDQVACEDAQRREDLARTDAQLGDWPQRSKSTDAWHRANDARALALQQQHLDAMRRCGAL